MERWGVQWEDARMYGLKEQRVGRLRWFGHVKRGDGEELGRVVGVEVPGHCSPGRPKETWRQCVGKDLATLDIGEAEAMDKDSWKCITDCLILYDNMGKPDVK